MVRIKKDARLWLILYLLPLFLMLHACTFMDTFEKILGLQQSNSSPYILIALLNSSTNPDNSGGDQASPDFSDDTHAPWEGGPSYYARWTNGPSTDPGFFPITIWLQSPGNANAYKAIGINTFVGLWTDQNETQATYDNKLSRLVSSQMPVLCEQNSLALASGNKNIIRSWTQQDEPDNAQWNSTTSSYDPPVLPAAVISRYASLAGSDSTRPVFLNLGQGAAWDGWYGRGTRTNCPQDYPEYIKGADIISFDIYPVNSGDAAVQNNIWLVAYGIDRLRQWANYKKIVWNWIECTDYNGSGRKPTPAVVKAEVWMSIIHGSMGIGYFAHVFSPNFIEAGLLSDAVMSSAVAAINSRITSLAQVLNTQSVSNGVSVTSSQAGIPVDTMLKRYNNKTYLFAVSMRPGSTTATFSLRSFPANATAEVLDENRAIAVQNGKFSDSFTDYSVHLYRISF